MAIFHVQFTKESGLDPLDIDADCYKINENNDDFVSFLFTDEDDGQEYYIASFNKNIVISVIGEDTRERIKLGSLCIL